MRSRSPTGQIVISKFMLGAIRRYIDDDGNAETWTLEKDQEEPQPDLPPAP